MSKKPSSDQIIQGTMGSYLQMPYNRYLWLRLEFMAICNDEIEAKIMRIVEYDIEGARTTWLNNASALAANGKPYPPAPEQWWVTLSYKQIMTKMYGTVKNEKTIIAKLNSLVKEKKYLQKRVDPENPYGAPQYTINKEVVQGKLDKLPPLPMIPDVAKLYSEISSDPVPATGTPSNKEGEYQPVVPPVPATGTPRTSEWNSPVPATGTEGYQPLVHNNNRENTNNQREGKNATTPTVTTDKPETPSSTHSSLPSVSSSQENQSPKEEKPSSEITRVKGYWKQLGYREEKSAAWEELAEKTKTFEDFKSLFDFTAEQLKKDTKITNKEVHPGNMLNYLNAWKQDKKRREQPAQQPQAPKPYGRDLKAEHQKMVAEMTAKMAASSRK